MKADHTYEVNVHCGKDETVWEAIERATGWKYSEYEVGLSQSWRDYVDPIDPYPPGVPEGTHFAGFVTVRMNETFPVFKKGE